MVDVNVSLGKYVEAITRAQTTQEVFDLFCAAMREQGCDRISSATGDGEGIGRGGPVGALIT